MTTSKTIAALLGPTLVASAVSLLANLATSQAIIDEPCAHHDCGLRRIRAGSCHCLLPQQMDARLASAGDRDGRLSLVVGLLRMVFPTQLAAMMMKVAPSAASVIPVVAIVFLAIGAFLSFKAYARE